MHVLCTSIIAETYVRITGGWEVCAYRHTFESTDGREHYLTTRGRMCEVGETVELRGTVNGHSIETEDAT